MAENNGNGRWLSPEETVAAGLADRIVRGRRKRPKGERSAVRNLASGWNRLLAALGLHGAAAPAGAAAGGRPPQHPPPRRRGSGRRPFGDRSRRGQRRHRATQVLAAEDPSVGENPPLGQRSGLCRRRAAVQDGGYKRRSFPRRIGGKIFLQILAVLLDQARSTRKKELKSILTFTLGKFRSFDSAFPARSRFTTFCHQKVAPKVSAERKTRGPADGLRLKRYADKLAPAFSTGASAARSSSRFFAMRSCCALRATMIICWCLFLAVLWPARMHCFRYFRSAIPQTRGLQNTIKRFALRP